MSGGQHKKMSSSDYADRDLLGSHRCGGESSANCDDPDMSGSLGSTDHTSSGADSNDDVISENSSRGSSAMTAQVCSSPTGVMCLLDHNFVFSRLQQFEKVTEVPASGPCWQNQCSLIMLL